MGNQTPMIGSSFHGGVLAALIATFVGLFVAGGIIVSDSVGAYIGKFASTSDDLGIFLVGISVFLGAPPLMYMVFKLSRDLSHSEHLFQLEVQERHRTGMALRESEARIHGILEDSVMGIVIHRDHQPLFVNESYARMMGYSSPAAILERPSILEQVVPEERERLRRYNEQTIAGSSDIPLAYEVQGLRHDGTAIWLEQRVRLMQWGGEPVVFLTVMDISDRRHANQALRESEERLARAQTIARLGNWEWQIDDNTIWWSDEVYRLFGVSPDKISPTFDIFLSLVHPEDRPVVDAAVKHAVANRGAYSIDHRILWPDGEVRHVHEQGEFRFDELGKPMSLLGTVYDITDRKRTEEALRAGEERYRHFAADVAHELRTPLAVMRAKLDNQERDGLRLSGEGEKLRNDVDSMSRLVEQLLAATRLETFMVGRDETADLRAVALAVATQFAPLAIQKERSIEVIGDEEPVVVHGNADTLEQAVRNLVENAIRYARPQTAVSINVCAADRSISVINLGDPIPMNMRDSIFGRYSRADRRSAGLGLGLSIVKRTVDAHHAVVTVGDPPVGDGAAFTISFPESFGSALEYAS